MKKSVEDLHINCKEIKTIEEIKNLKRWDFVACKFKRNVWWSNWFNFWIFEIYEIHERQPEIILEKKLNIYFNYEMYLKWESQLSSIYIIK